MTDIEALWWPAYVAFALGGVGGLLLVTTLPPRERAESKEAGGETPQSAEGELEAVVAALRALEGQRAQLEDAFFAEEKARLESQAVALLKAMQAPAVAPASVPASPTSRAHRARANGGRASSAFIDFFRQRPSVQAAAWLVLLSTTGAVLWRNLADASFAEPASMGAAPVAGDAMVTKAEFDALAAALRDNPDDVPTLLRVAHLALRAQQFDEATTFNDRALSLAPTSLEGRTHRAVLAAKDGEAAPALATLADINRADPGFAEAWFFRGMLAMQQGQMDTMQEAFGQFVRIAPDGPQKERVRAMMARSKT